MKIIILILLACLLYCIFRIIKKYNTIQSQLPINHSNNIQEALIINFGQKIQNKIPRSIPIKKQHLPSKIIPLYRKTVDYIVGKYSFTDPKVIEYVEILTERLIFYLLENDRIDNIINKCQKNNYLILEVCRDLFLLEELPHITRILIGQFIINNTNENEEIMYIYNYISDVAINPSINRSVRMNAADIINMSNNSFFIKKAQQSLEILRHEDDQKILPVQQGLPNVQYIRQEPIDQGIELPFNVDLKEQERLLARYAQTVKKNRTIYEDGQNVHNTEINESALKVAKQLIDKYEPKTTLTIDKKLLDELSSDKREKVEKAIHRITTDGSHFKYSTHLFPIYQSVLNYIEQSDYKEELKKRLIEEMIDMSGLCATGSLSRLVNVIQGFDLDNTMSVKIKSDDEIYAKISHLFQRQIQSNPEAEELIIALADDTADKTILNNFIRKSLTNIRPILSKEYGNAMNQADLDDNILNAVRKFLKNETFVI
jgi:hypothetical protein